jgi:hypothetical protein
MHISIVAERIIRGKRDINIAPIWATRNSPSISKRNFGSIWIMWQQYGYDSQALTVALLLRPRKRRLITRRRND